MEVEQFIRNLIERAREYGTGHVLLRRQPVESLLNAVAGVLGQLPPDHALAAAYRTVYEELQGKTQPPQQWYGPGGTSGG